MMRATVVPATVVSVTVMSAVVMLFALGGCGAAPSPTPATVAPADGFAEFYADENVTGEVAVTVVTAGDGGALSIRLRLRNHGGRPLELTESTRCQVLRWSILDAQGDTVQAMPNRPCAQQLATHALPPAHAIERVYQIPLTVRPGSYTLRFTFWNLPGARAFEVR